MKVSETRNTKEVNLPSGGKVIIFDELLYGDVKRVALEKDTQKRNTLVVLSLIKDWDLENEKGEKLEIKEASIDVLPMSDIITLTKAVNQFSESKKKVTKNSKPSGK